MAKEALLKVGTALVLFTGSIMAKDRFQSDTFIKVEVGKKEIQGLTGSGIKKVSDTGYSVGVGAQNVLWRTSILFTSLDAGSQHAESMTLFIDHYFLNKSDMNVLSAYSLQPFIGLHLGYANYESLSVDESGVVYGAQLGVNIALTQELDLDIAYKHTVSAMDQFDHETGVTVGLGYFF